MDARQPGGPCGERPVVPPVASHWLTRGGSVFVPPTTSASHLLLKQVDLAGHRFLQFIHGRPTTVKYPQAADLWGKKAPKVNEARVGNMEMTWIGQDDTVIKTGLPVPHNCKN